MPKVAVVGSREWADTPFMHHALRRYHEKHGIDVLVSGGARGADTIGERWAKANSIPVVIHLPDWSTGRGAGFDRNTLIVRDADVVIAFVTDIERSRGTMDTVRKAQAAGKTVFVYDGATQTWSQSSTPPEDPVCKRCAGTGKSITQVVNGQPVGPGGDCFRCGGKGYITDADRRRDWGYDDYGQKVRD